MRTVVLLLLVAGTALACVQTGSRRTKREELLRRAKRRWVLSTIEVTEEDPGPFPKEISQMYNDKQGTVDSYSFRISGVGVTEPPLGVFSIDELTGKVYALQPIDREKISCFHIKFDIVNRKTNEKIDKELSFDVEIKDINDNDPVFLKSKRVVQIKENIDEGLLPVQLHAVDPDQPNSPNSTMTITLHSQTPNEPKFTVEQVEDRPAQLKYSGCFNYDKANNYEIIAKVTDHGIPPRSSTAVITLVIVDTNTHLPTFKKTEYCGEVQEMAIKKEVLRVAVEDKDSIGTPGWRAKYFFVTGNEDENFKMETDPKTNEGILSVVKGKDSERTINMTLQIGVENEEPLFFCKYNPGKAPSPSTVNITIKVVATNDPPYFDKDTTNVYQKEEEPSGQVLFTPKVTDPDSDLDKIRYVLLHDPAQWMKIDPKTGEVTTVKKMDRESPFVNNSVYKILVGAIDDGEPQATGTGTVLIHLKDINDHKPTLLNNSVILCVNMENDKVPVKVQDLDAPPYTGPFAFALDDEESTLKENWKLDPASGEEGGLVMLKSLAYGNYTIPLVIEDQQNLVSKEKILVVVCECGESGACIKQSRSVKIGGPAIGLILGALLLFLLLLLVFMCLCGKQFQKTLVDEGNQTLIKYNQEGGSSECKAEPSLFLMTTNQNNVTVTNGQKQVNAQPGMTTIVTDEVDMYNYLYREEMGMQRERDTMRNNGMYNTMNSDMYTLSNRTNTYQSSRYSHYGLANQHIADLLYTKLQVLSGAQAAEVAYQPHEYAYEGEASLCQSLDELSLANEDDLQFLNSLGPKFKTLGGICQQTFEKKNTQL